MTSIQIAFAASAALLACQAARKEAAPAASAGPALAAKPAARPITGKPQAPVVIEAVLAAGSAAVTIQVAQAATGVEVRASGAEGLAVQGESLLAATRSVAAGEVLAFQLGFTPGPGQSLLAIRVKGDFGDGERASVRAFAVGKPSATQQKQARERTTQVGGEAVRLEPAQEEKK